MQSLRVLTFNISGANCSALAPPSFGLPAKYAAVAQLVLAEQPELVTLQEVFPEAVSRSRVHPWHFTLPAGWQQGRQWKAGTHDCLPSQ